MSINLRNKVLQSFKALHKARKETFAGDVYALSEARKRINEEYQKKKHVSDVSVIDELVKYANEVERELKTTVIQIKETKPGRYQAKITKETVKLDNVPFKDCNGS